MSKYVNSVRELLEIVGLTAEEAGYSSQADSEFPLRLPRAFLERIKKGDPQDPILRQILPHKNEMQAVSGFTDDPVGESGFSPASAVLQKYPGRVLLIVTGACAVNCRYCFRRHFPYSEQEASLTQAFEWLAQQPSIHEVILSGGDPLTLSQRRLASIHQRLAELPHITRLRIHSRTPIVDPSCITEEFVALFSDPRFQASLVVHVNHPNELTDDVANALMPLRQAGVTLLNQSVLLADINDDVETLTHLSERLFACGILPYYLHQLDKVAGAAHFGVDNQKALTLHQQLRDQLSGFLVPRLVVELAGKQSKTPLIEGRHQSQ